MVKEAKSFMTIESSQSMLSTVLLEKERSKMYLHELLSIVVEYAILLFEYIGVVVLIVTCLKGFISWVKKDESTRLNLAKGMAMGLEFKLGSEILRTVVVRDFNEMLVVAGIIVLRAALTLLIHWEIKEEESK